MKKYFFIVHLFPFIYNLSVFYLIFYLLILAFFLTLLDSEIKNRVFYLKKMM